MRVQDIRKEFIRKYQEKEFVTDKSGVRLLEIVGASFLADEPTIFGEVNEDYALRELDWYNSMSLNVNTIPPPVPKIWKQVATPDGRINSNYGYLMYSKENGNQYKNVVDTLIKHRESRRAVAIYTRPTMHTDFNKDGMSDFICTNAVSYLIRNNKVHAVVQMRSGDIYFGFRNDLYWQKYVLREVVLLHNMLVNDESLYVTSGDIHWQVSSFHMYEPHFSKIDEFLGSAMQKAMDIPYN